MAYTLIEQNGEKMLVRSLDGHEGATVLAKNITDPPDAFSRLVGGKWTEDSTAKEQARLKRLSRAELIEEIVRRVKG